MNSSVRLGLSSHFQIQLELSLIFLKLWVEILREETSTTTKENELYFFRLGNKKKITSKSRLSHFFKNSNLRRFISFKFYVKDIGSNFKFKDLWSFSKSLFIYIELSAQHSNIALHWFSQIIHFHINTSFIHLHWFSQIIHFYINISFIHLYWI